MPTCESIVKRTGSACGKKASTILHGKSLCGLHIRSQNLADQKTDDARVRTLEDWLPRIALQISLEENAHVEWGRTLLDMDPHRGLRLQDHPHVVDLWLARHHAKEKVVETEKRTKAMVQRSRGFDKIVLATLIDDARRAVQHEGQSFIYRRRARDERFAEETVLAQRRAEARAEPITFVRDPVGDIALREFANDAQNVHRSSIQNATVVSIQRIMEAPVGENPQTLVEIEQAFQTFRRCDRIMRELNRDISLRKIVGFGFSYKDLLDHVWCIVSSHIYRSDLIVRLYQELREGYKMCSNGKMCRLVNVLQGYDDSIINSVCRDAFQHKFATLAKLPLNERSAAAKTVLADYSIPSDEWSLWIEPLLEA